MKTTRLGVLLILGACSEYGFGKPDDGGPGTTADTAESAGGAERAIGWDDEVEFDPANEDPGDDPNGDPTDGDPTDGDPTDGDPTDGDPTDGDPTDPNSGTDGVPDGEFDGEIDITQTDEEATICELAANIDGYLDLFQEASDGHVLYCHQGHLVDSNIDSCSAHLDHVEDVFPTTLCDT